MANSRVRKSLNHGPRNHNAAAPKTTLEQVRRDLKLTKSRLTALQRERRQLRHELVTLRKERDQYRGIAYAWARKLMPEVGPDHFPREQDCAPFSQVIADITKQLKN